MQRPSLVYVHTIFEIEIRTHVVIFKPKILVLSKSNPCLIFHRQKQDFLQHTSVLIEELYVYSHSILICFFQDQ